MSYPGHKNDLINCTTGFFYFCLFFPLGACEEAWKMRVRQSFSKSSLHNLHVAFKGLLTSNYRATCLLLRATVMSLGYQRIILVRGSCPVLLQTGDTEISRQQFSKNALPFQKVRSARLVIWYFSSKCTLNDQL